MSQPTVNITGISGFVGQNLSQQLSDSYAIQGISRTPQPGQISYEQFFSSHAEYHALIHLAGKAHDTKNSAEAKDYTEANYALTKKVYDHFLRSEAQCFIFMSSVKAVADEVDGELTEEVVPNPISPYGISKQNAEAYILANLSADKRVYILRPCMVHGPGNKGNLTLLYNLVRKGIPYPLGAFHNQRSFLSIDNLAFVVQQLLSSQLPSAVYHLADDESLSTTELVELMGQATKRKVAIWSIPKFLIAGLARLGDFLPLPLNSNQLQKLTENYRVSNAKIKADLHIELPVSARTGLLKTIVSFNK
jgi:nucleoside-diphosphate-sugar epimerase